MCYLISGLSSSCHMYSDPSELSERMEKLLSNGITYQTVPKSHIFPPDKRPGCNLVPSGKIGIPVIDLGGGGAESPGHDHAADIAQQIIKAGKEFGFFQVVNHGVPEKVIREMMSVAKEFIEMPIEDKAQYYSDDPQQPVRLHASLGYNTEEIMYWRDSLKLTCNPIEQFLHLWPEKPSRLRDIVNRYSRETIGVAERLLGLICEGLGLEHDYFREFLTSGQHFLVVNFYPPCPDPSLTLGLPKHCDPNLITILNQRDVNGLQVIKDGDWIMVDPLPNAFVVNLGHQLEVISNRMLRSVEHRAMTNSTVSRTTVVVFVKPSMDSVITPAVCDEKSPPLYRSFKYEEFVRNFVSNEIDPEKALEAFRISSDL